LHDPFASLLYITMDEEECKKTAAAFVRLIASLNAVRLMAFGVGAAGGIVGLLR